MKIIFVTCEGKKKNIHSTLQALEKAGNSVFFVYSPMICSNWNLYIRLKRKLKMDISDYTKKKEKAFEKKLLNYCKEIRPDVVYDMGGFLLNDSAIERIRSHNFIILHLMDRINAFPRLSEIIDKYDAVFTYASGDYDMMIRKNLNCFLFPSGGDNSMFYKMGNIKKKYDVSFVGSMFPDKDYGYRWGILSRLVVDFPNVRMRVAGKCATIFSPKRLLIWLKNRKMRQTFLNRSISLRSCNKLYNESRIVLCMERNGFGDSWSSRLANALNTGSFALLMNNDHLRTCLGQDFVFFSDYEDLKKKILYYLENEVERETMAHREYDALTKQLSGCFSLNEILYREYCGWKEKHETKHCY